MAWCRIVRGAGGAIVRIGLNNSLNYSLLKGREILELRERLPSWPLGGIFPVSVLVAVWSAILFEFSVILFLFTLAICLDIILVS